jgi:hypothetical protein
MFFGWNKSYGLSVHVQFICHIPGKSVDDISHYSSHFSTIVSALDH